jgi:FixJ family two-component response regulator
MTVITSQDILIVDDEVGIRELLSEILQDEGYRVALAENAHQARAYRQRQQPALVLLDIWMPDTDGVTLLREWGASGQLTMPVVMMSGHGTIETAVEATRIGAIDFLEKPIGLAKLLSTIARALKSAAVREPRRVSLATLGTAQPVRDAERAVEQVLAARKPLLLLGESGTGHDAAARAVAAPGTPLCRGGSGSAAGAASRSGTGTDSARGSAWADCAAGTCSGRRLRITRPRSSPPRTADSSRAIAIGFSRNSSAPKRVASTAVSIVACPDIMITGIVSWPCDAHSFSSVTPSVSGIQMSSSTRSSCSRCRAARAAAAFSAVTTTWPSSERISERSSRMPISSSTTRMLAMGADAAGMRGRVRQGKQSGCGTGQRHTRRQVEHR